MDSARKDVPREVGYDPATWVNPPRSNLAYVPTGLESRPVSAHVPVVGILVLGALVLLFEHFRKGR